MKKLIKMTDLVSGNLVPIWSGNEGEAYGVILSKQRDTVTALSRNIFTGNIHERKCEILYEVRSSNRDLDSVFLDEKDIHVWTEGGEKYSEYDAILKQWSE